MVAHAENVQLACFGFAPEPMAVNLLGWHYGRASSMTFGANPPRLNLYPAVKSSSHSGASEQ